MRALARWAVYLGLVQMAAAGFLIAVVLADGALPWGAQLTLAIALFTESIYLAGQKRPPRTIGRRRSADELLAEWEKEIGR